MGSARRNPRGFHVEPQHQAQALGRVVRVGDKGGHTHFFDAAEGEVICLSGAHLQKGERVFYPAFARGDRPGKVDYMKPAAVTCYRCVKLASYNVAQGRAPWEGPPDG